MPKRLPKGKMGIEELISSEFMAEEKSKTDKILHQIELVMKLKKRLATQEPQPVGKPRRLTTKDNVQQPKWNPSGTETQNKKLKVAKQESDEEVVSARKESPEKEKDGYELPGDDNSEQPSAQKSIQDLRSEDAKSKQISVKSEFDQIDYKLNVDSIINEGEVITHPLYIEYSKLFNDELNALRKAKQSPNTFLD